MNCNERFLIRYIHQNSFITFQFSGADCETHNLSLIAITIIEAAI